MGSRPGLVVMRGDALVFGRVFVSRQGILEGFFAFICREIGFIFVKTENKRKRGRERIS